MNRSFCSFVVGINLVLLLMLPAITRGDSWGPPKRDHWSDNQQWALIIGFKGGKTLSLCQKTGDGLKEHWQRGYVNRTWPPHRAYVTNDGKHVVLRDVYHNLGHGKVIVILGEKGKILGSYELKEFLSQDEILRARRSVSSLLWNESAWFSFVDSDRKFALVTQFGTLCCFDLATGELLELDDERMSETLEYIRQEANQWQQSENMSVRIRGLRCKASMGVKEAVPTAKALINDTDTVAAERLAAASALTRLMGLDAIPIIEKALPDANRNMRKELLNVLAGLDESGLEEIFKTDDSEALRQMWVRLTEHALADVRERAILEVLQRDDETYLTAHPELIEHESNAVRASAIRNWGAIKSPQASLMIRKGISDPETSIRRMSLMSLVAREPNDTEALLLRFLDENDRSMRNYVVCQLASRGHPAAIRKLQETIATWASFDPEADNMWALVIEIETLCKLIADLKLDGVRESLAEIQSIEDLWVSAFINGALAAVGDQQATATLHRLARDGKSAERIYAVEMCRYLTDQESARIVQEAVTAKDPDVRIAATKQLTRFKDRRSP